MNTERQLVLHDETVGKSHKQHIQHLLEEEWTQGPRNYAHSQCWYSTTGGVVRPQCSDDKVRGAESVSDSEREYQ